MILFVGQVGTDVMGREAFQEVDYPAFFGPLAKWAVQIDHVDRVPEIISRAWTVASSGRPGPVVVALPEDMLVATSTAEPCHAVTIPEPAPAAADISALGDLLAESVRPVVIVGGTRWQEDSARAIERFAVANEIPVVAAFRFHDIIDNHCAAYAGDAGVGMNASMKTLLRDADLIIALNIRFGEATTDGYTLFDAPKMTAKLVHSHASDDEIGKIYVADLPLHAGPNRMAAALGDMVADRPQGRAGWYADARTAYLESLVPPAQPGDVDMGIITAQIQARLPSDAIITHGAGNFSIWANKFMQYGRDQRLLGPQSGSMGFGLPAALAAKARQESQQGALLLTQQLLRRLAGEDLDNALLNMLQEDLQALSAAEHDEITNALHKQTTLLVTSARPLAPDQLQQLQHTLTDTLHQTVSLDTRLDESLISGIRLNIGPLTLHANLVDELEFFKAELHHAI